MTWDGQERRGGNSADHDLLTKIDVNLTNFMEKYADHIRRFDSHILEDNKKFLEIEKQLNAVQKVLWSAAGVIIFVEFIVRLIK